MFLRTHPRYSHALIIAGTIILVTAFLAIFLHEIHALY